MRRPFTLTFPSGAVASRIRVGNPAELPVALRRIGLDQPRPTLALVGGAKGLAVDEMAQLRALFENVIAPTAEQLALYVVDGGTEAGIMSLMGEARAAVNGTFSLIGVAATGTVALPTQTPIPEDAALLEPHHTHFVLVPGTRWGDEAMWISEVASALSDGLPSLTLLINGGEITWLDARCSVQAGRPVLVLDGTGRTADAIAAALRGEPTDLRAADLVSSGLMGAMDIASPREALVRAIEEALFRKGEEDGAETTV